MTDSPTQQMQCMEVWGGSQLTSGGVDLAGLDVWVYSKPFGQAQRGAREELARLLPCLLERGQSARCCDDLA